MNSFKIFAIVLIVLGVLALVYGGFSYTSETHEASIGALSLSIDEKRTVNVPIWAGVAALVAGGLMFFLGGSRRQ
jgi:TRAP-type C4-dicarboxylate transport system permease small subunit